jgi:hypothetical protein
MAKPSSLPTAEIHGLFHVLSNHKPYGYGAECPMHVSSDVSSDKTLEDIIMDIISGYLLKRDKD